MGVDLQTIQRCGVLDDGLTGAASPKPKNKVSKKDKENVNLMKTFGATIGGVLASPK
jgi:hypothetical protein